MTLKEIFQSDSYPKSFIDKFFKKFFDKLQIVKPTLATAENALRLLFPYLRPIYLQVRTKIINAMKRTLNCCKFQVIFKKERKSSNMSRLKDRVPMI